jgi:hypothetical protein
MLGQQAGAQTSFVDFSSYQKSHPLIVAVQPRSTGASYLTADFEPTAHALALARRARAGRIMSVIKQNTLVQRLRGKHQVLGPRRAVLCAVMRR